MDNRYDSLFKDAVAEMWAACPHWHWLKAQAMAESSLNPNAVSHCGARGLMQIMPATWDEIRERIEIHDPFSPSDSIRAGAFYMRRMWDCWWARGISESECLKFAQASYNAGQGNIKRAWRLTRTSDQWNDVAAQLINVTGKHASETTAYVRRIERFFKEIHS